MALFTILLTVLTQPIPQPSVVLITIYTPSPCPFTTGLWFVWVTILRQALGLSALPELTPWMCGTQDLQCQDGGEEGKVVEHRGRSN